jgi:oligoribonuclease (3'-5' exoribonuclease)
MKHFMLDIETMGTDPTSDDVIQIGILELDEVDGFFIPGRAFSRTLFTSQKPKDEWIATNHKDLLEVCRRTPMTTAKQIRSEILSFFRTCGFVGAAPLMGLNLMSLDIPFLLAKGYLERGDFHYRVYELRGSYNTARIALGLDDKSFFERSAAAYPEIELPAGKKHEALYDCYSQLKTLNGSIRLLRRQLAG